MKLLAQLLFFAVSVAHLGGQKAFCQGPWQVNGNPLGINTTNNRVGPQQDVPLRVITNDFDRIRIMGGDATTGGYVGIGNVGGGFTPASTVHIHGVAGLVDPVLRLTSPATGPTAGDGFGIGIAFNQQEARPVLFSTQRQNRLT
jgi:hypothetical protein